MPGPESPAPAVLGLAEPAFSTPAGSPSFPITVQAPQAVAFLGTSDNAFGSVVDLNNTTDSPTLLGAINFSSATGTPGQIAYESGNEMTFRTNNAERMRITSTGDVTNGIALNGLVKAWAKLNADGSVIDCWRCDPAGTTSDGLGLYFVDFSPLALDISGRPVLCSSIRARSVQPDTNIGCWAGTSVVDVSVQLLGGGNATAAFNLVVF